eukprot:scaffold71620_cov72-Phaeocystis_antarctica.AAC.1
MFHIISKRSRLLVLRLSGAARWRTQASAERPPAPHSCAARCAAARTGRPQPRRPRTKPRRGT